MSLHEYADTVVMRRRIDGLVRPSTRAQSLWLAGLYFRAAGA